LAAAAPSSALHPLCSRPCWRSTMRRSTDETCAAL
jgi:hypothetical protein